MRENKSGRNRSSPHTGGSRTVTSAAASFDQEEALQEMKKRVDAARKKLEDYNNLSESEKLKIPRTVFEYKETFSWHKPSTVKSEDFMSLLQKAFSNK
jgi:DUF4097 and DUF4098 domain-containing protein YvlB